MKFFLNHFQYDGFKERDKGVLAFSKCHKFSFNSMNDEGYFLEQYRYKHSEIPWGEFYVIDSDWRTDFPKEHLILLPINNPKKLNHYIFFLRDNTLEAVAESFEIKFIQTQ